MGFWPFGGSKRQRSSEPSRQGQEKLIESQNSEDNARLEKASTDFSGDARRNFRRDRDSRLLSRSQGTNSDQTPRSQTDPITIPAIKRLSRNNQQSSANPLYQHEPTSQSSLGPENFTVIRQPPTLHARRSDYDPNIGRRKSSKRKAEDHARELEVRAMSSSPIPIPRRPNSFYGTGPLQRDTKQIPGKLNRKLTRPTSEVSLPLPDALPGISDLSTQNSFKIGVFAALSPRPTVKYDNNPNIGRGKQTQSERPNLLARPSILVEEGAETKRIDELADELDAGGLRELMERDKRRRERKKEQDRLRLQRKLQRRADRQREDEARQARTEEYVHESASRIGLGIQSPKIEHADTAGSEAGPSGTHRKETQESYQDPTTSTPISPVVIRNPFEDENEKDFDAMRDEGSDHDQEPPIPAKSPLRKLQTESIPVTDRPIPATLSPPRSPVPRAEDRQSMSQGSLLNREVTTDAPEKASLEGRASDHSSQRLSSWTTFFRRGTRRKLSSSFQGRSTPSEFSNTSRESFAARKQPIPPVVAPRTFRRADSTTPQRTMSKFREDLPELPISPPDSRLQSPEAMEVTPSGLSRALTAAAKQPETKSTELERTNTTPSQPVPTRTLTGQEASMDLDMPGRADMPLSQSLASVDSEGSWLSGKALHRLSGPSQRLKGSRSSLNRTMPGAFDGSSDIPPALDTPSDPDRTIARQNSQNEKGDETWHAGLGRQPTLIRQASRAKSKEGLLNEYTAKEEHLPSPESDDEAQTTGDEEAEVVEPTIMRARSVDYKGHIRHISGGSARLLDIRRQSSVSETSLRQQEKRRAASHDELSKQPPL